MTLADLNTAMSDQAFEKIAEIALSDAGLAIPKSKKALVQSRIDRRLRTLNIHSIQDYIALLHDQSNWQERKELISILTTNVSSFYRENHHFQFLINEVFPRLKEKASAGKKLRIWSAGCSSGQEPYTIAIELLRHFSQSELKNALILATDIDSEILKKAKRGVYPM
ncbi:MAG: CheR family methyltransferase, partial [Paracoccaceae bacterium]